MSSLAPANRPMPPARAFRRDRSTQLLLRLVVVLAAVIFAVFPIVWIISASFNPSSSMATQQFVPPNASAANYQKLLGSSLHPFTHWLWNSVRVAGVTSFLVVLITAFSAYAFSRFRFRGRRSLLLTILLIQVFPNMLAMIALFLLLQQIGAYVPWLGLNSHGGLILVYLGAQMGVNIWLMKGFFDSVPRDIDESALVDGASHWQAFWYLIVPLVRPVLAVVAILSFVGTYNEFILASVLLRTTENFTLMVGLYLFVTQNFAQTWGVFAAGALIGAIPIVALYLLLQDQIIGGLTQGAVKG